jgi:hypothetical protein
MIQNKVIQHHHRHTQVKEIQFASTRTERDEAIAKGAGDIPDVRHYLKIDVQNSTRWQENLQGMHWQRDAIAWDSELQGFVYRKEIFDQFGNGKRQERKSTENPFSHNAWIGQQVYVDATNKRLILPNGCFIDGPTGKMYTCQGVDMATFNQNNSAKEI